MFFERIDTFRRSLTFRLTFLYTGMFTILSLIAFFIFYEMMITRVHARTDLALAAKLKEFSSLLLTRGIETLKEEMINEAESTGTHKVFSRLLTAEGKEIISSDLRPWKGIGLGRIALKKLDKGGPVFETLKVSDAKHKVRVIYGIAGPGMVLQVGQSLRDDDRLMTDFREVFITAMSIVLGLAAIGGWLMAKRGLSGVEKVTQTAMAIADGAMGKRVPLTGRGDEIDRLSGVFNHMLERIQSLITEMREVTDNIAHDIKSPITRIRGLAEVTLTAERSIDDYQTTIVSTIEECDHLSKMINTMLEISETEAGVTTLNLSEVDVSAMIEEACDFFQVLAEDKGLSIEVNVPHRCFLRCDKEKLQRVISNLLDNAVKYTSSGKITISVEQSDKEVIILFHDTGIGISLNEIPHIFDRFYRTDKSRSAPGAGLGLSLVQAIVRRHGGEIKVSSSPDVGSTFTVVFPRRRGS